MIKLFRIFAFKTLNFKFLKFTKGMAVHINKYTEFQIFSNKFRKEAMGLF